ncbi:MAG: GTP-binding protein, partial [Ruthenibacterium sp.]
MEQTNIRNIAIIAHVDHGKTTLVDQMLKQGGAFRANQQVAERVMDSGDIERERGITILAKNACAYYEGVKINIVDTPGHADFGGEVERVLKMVNGVLLLVDAAEGCMPQTRFVLQKALQQNLSLVIAVNKIDRPDARIKEVIDEILMLLMDLNATDEQLDSPMVFCSGRAGTASYSPEVVGTDLEPLFKTILQYVKPPVGNPTDPLGMLCSSVDYNEFVGRIGIGRVDNGTIKVGQDVAVCDYHDPAVSKRGRITALYSFEANGRTPISEAFAGDIVAFSGLTDINIGNTLCDPSIVKPLPFMKINDPTVEMTFAVNDSPFAGKEGKFVTSRQIRDRLHKELLKDVALKVEDSTTSESFRVMGRGEMHLSILIETMRREGYELQVSPPKVLLHEENGKTLEPMEHIVIDVPLEYQGSVM